MRETTKTKLSQVTSCGIPKEIASIPLVFEEPIYGTKDLTFTDFMAPGIILTIVHSMSLGYRYGKKYGTQVA